MLVLIWSGLSPEQTGLNKRTGPGYGLSYEPGYGSDSRPGPGSGSGSVPRSGSGYLALECNEEIFPLMWLNGKRLVYHTSY